MEPAFDRVEKDLMLRIGRLGHTRAVIGVHLTRRAEERKAADRLIKRGLIRPIEWRPLSKSGKPDMRCKPEHQVEGTEAGIIIAKDLCRLDRERRAAIMAAQEAEEAKHGPDWDGYSK